MGRGNRKLPRRAYFLFYWSFPGGCVRQFDLAVVGADLGVLAAAALLSTKGKKVVVCTSAASLPAALGRGDRQGFCFSSHPSLTYGFEDGGAIHRLLMELGIGDLAPAHATDYQIAFPDRRLTVSAKQEETLEELRREFPKDALSVKQFYQDIKDERERFSRGRVAAFIARHKSAGSFLRKYDFSKELRYFFDIQSHFFFQRSVADLSLVNLSTLCTHPPFQYYGVFEMLAERLADVLLRQGGEIRFNEPSTEVLFRDDRVHVQTSQGTIGAESVLLVTYHNSMPVLFLGIHDDVVPVGMVRDVLYLPDYSQPGEFCVLSLSAKDDINYAPPGMRALTVAGRTVGNLRQDASALIGRTASLVPFLQDHIVRIEEFHPQGAAAVPNGVVFKPVRSRREKSQLFETSKHMYMLDEAHHAPLQTIIAARKLVERLL